MRENYLESIDNIIEVDQETIRESHASPRYGINKVSDLVHCCAFLLRILNSLTRFSDEVVINSTEDKQRLTVAKENYALQVQEIDPSLFAGDSFNVDLGTVEEAMNTSGNIDPQALLTLLSPLSNATGSLSVSERVVADCNSSNVRLGYSVFVSSSLFPTESVNTTVASIILNLRLRNFNACKKEIIDDLFNVTFQAIDPPVSGTVWLRQTT